MKAEANKGKKLSVRDLTLIAMMVAIIEVSKVAMANLPNVELTSFWIILFALYLGKRIYYAVPVFILIEGLMYGLQIWWVMYLYAWPMLALLTRCFRKMDSALGWAIFSGAFGLSFGALCAIPYFFIGAVSGGLMHGLSYAFGWWVAGIPFDLIHCAGNFGLMLVLYKPIKKALISVSTMLEKNKAQ